FGWLDCGLPDGTDHVSGRPHPQGTHPQAQGITNNSVSRTRLRGAGHFFGQEAFMDLFASDLDNTLIYSYKRDIGTDTVCAEVYEGRQVSFMTKRSRELLEKVNQTMHFVPVTTRSVQQ